MDFELQNGKLGYAQLLWLNQLLQALPLEQRLDYLYSLNEDLPWEIQESAHLFMDKRDYNIYTVVKIGEQEWLGENLRYTGVLHQKSPEQVNLFYGCLYDWATVMGVFDIYNSSDLEKEDLSGEVQGIAPEGWVVPSDEDWMILERSLGVREEIVKSTEDRSVVGAGLKSREGWYNANNGNNSTGFNALPAGYWLVDDLFFDAGDSTYFWTSTAYGSSVHEAWSRSLWWDEDTMCRSINNKALGCSLRCVRKEKKLSFSRRQLFYD